MKIKTTKLSGDYIDCKRVWDNGGKNLTAEIGGTTAKGTFMKVELKLDFDCLQYIMNGVKRACEVEKEIRVASIEAVDKSLGI